MSQVNNTQASFKLNDTLAVIIPFSLILATAAYSAFITVALFIVWGIITYFNGVKVTNHKTGQEELMHDLASSAFSMKHQAKDLYQGIKHASLIAADEFNHQQEMRDIKLQVLGTTMADQDAHKNAEREVKVTEYTAKRDERKAAKKAIAAEFRATYLVD